MAQPGGQAVEFLDEAIGLGAQAVQIAERAAQLPMLGRPNQFALGLLVPQVFRRAPDFSGLAGLVKEPQLLLLGLLEQRLEAQEDGLHSDRYTHDFDPFESLQRQSYTPIIEPNRPVGRVLLAPIMKLTWGGRRVGGYMNRRSPSRPS